MKFLLKAIIWPIKKILLFPIKLLFFIIGSLIVLIFLIQYRIDYDTDVSPLKGYEVEACTEIIENTKFVKGIHNISFDTSNLENGTYFIKYQSNEMVNNVKFVVAH